MRRCPDTESFAVVVVGAGVAAHGAAVAVLGATNAAAGIANLFNQNVSGEGGGTQVTSETLYNRRSVRVDVENPNPAQRPSQVHIQIGKDNYVFDPATGKFKDAPRSVQKLLEDERIRKAIERGVKQYLGQPMPKQ